MHIIDLAAEPEHLPTLAAWHHQQWVDLNPGFVLSERVARMQAYLGADLVPSTFVGKWQGRLAGSAAIIESDMDTRPELSPWLASVYVAPEFRDRGVGSALVRHAMAQVEAAGVGALYLFTPDRASFYRRLGWRSVAEEFYRGHAVTVMRVDF